MWFTESDLRCLWSVVHGRMEGRQAHLGLLGRQLLYASLVVAEQGEGGWWHIVVWAGLYLHAHTRLGNAASETWPALPEV